MNFRSTTLWLFLLRQGHSWHSNSYTTLARNPRMLTIHNPHCFHSSTAVSMASKSDTDTKVPFQGRTSKQVWRPDKQDVERISWGKPAKKKGTGSRGVPHRINQEERLLFDQARNKGFLEVAGSGWRSQRRDAPLCNTYRSWCDACAQVSIIVHKGSTGMDDAVVVDLSPLRLETAEEFQAVAMACLEQRPNGRVQSQGGSNIYEDDEDSDSDDENAELLLDSDAWETRPIYQLPPYCIVWEGLERNEAKKLAKMIAKLCDTGDKQREKKSKKPVGVKPGKNRRHGGYGIG